MGKCVWVGQSKSLVSKQIIVAAFSLQIICFPYREVRSAVTNWCICSPLPRGTGPEWRWLAKYDGDTGWGVGHVTLTPCRSARSGAGSLLEGQCTSSSIWAKAGRAAARQVCPGLRTLPRAQSLSLKSSWGSAKAPHPSPPLGALLKWCSPAWGGVPGEEHGILDPKPHRLHWKGPL